jgi:ribokinase
MRVGVVGHIEWIEFLRVPRVPATGDIVQVSQAWEEPAGGGGVASVELARLAGSATLFTVFGDDERGHRARSDLEAFGVEVESVLRPNPQRRGFVYVDDEGERTITIVGEKLRPRCDEPLPWARLREFDAIYFTAGDADALRAAREARVLVATARELPTLLEAGVALDALVASARDPAERYEGELDPGPGLVVRTEGKDGGAYEPGGGRWAAAPLPGPLGDTYGAGDSFAAALTFALGEGREPDDALAFAASRSALALTRRGAHGRPSME